MSGLRQQQKESLHQLLKIISYWLNPPASLNPLLVVGEGGEEEGAHVEVDKGQAEDRIVAKGSKNRQWHHLFILLVEKRNNLTKKILVEKLAMVKETRSVKVVIVIATPACSITFHNIFFHLS